MDGLDPFSEHGYIESQIGYRPFIYNPSAFYGLISHDWQEGINLERLRKERLEKLKQKMKEFGFDALVLFNGENIRYATGVWQGNWKSNIFVRYAVVPINGDPVLFETAGADMLNAIVDAPWLRDRIKPAITWVWHGPATQVQARRMAESIKEVLKEHGVASGNIGVDVLEWNAFKAFNEAGLKIDNAWPAVVEARKIKTRDEIELIKRTINMVNALFAKIRDEWLRPGISEIELSAKFSEWMIAHGFEAIPQLIVASGRNTNPYRRWTTSKITKEGDLVIIDIAGPGPGGYWCDFTRTFIAGKAKPTEEDKETYWEAYNSLYDAIKAIKPGATTKDIAEKFPIYDDDKYKTTSLFQFAHSIGLSLYEGVWVSRGHSLEYPERLEPNMVLAVETYVGKPGRRHGVRLEHDILITEEGTAEILTDFTMMEDLFR